MSGNGIDWGLYWEYNTNSLIKVNRQGGEFWGVFFVKKDCGCGGFGVNCGCVLRGLEQAILTLLIEDYYEGGF